MSTLKVEVVAIDAVEKHPNADRLDLYRVKGWHVVGGRDKPDTPRYKAGDKVLYVPIDSVLPTQLEEHLFPPDSKVRLSKSRVRTIKLRGAISQGMICDLEGLECLAPGISGAALGADVTKRLGITKYEPPEEDLPSAMKPGKRSQKQENPFFRKYTDIENFKNYTGLFQSGEPVYVTEKLHGTSARYAILPSSPAKWWQKLLKLVGLWPEYQFCYGSRNVQLQGGNKQCYYGQNVYSIIAKQYQIASKLKPGEALYGEIVGDGIQKGYTYGCKPGEYKFYAYDVMVDGAWLDSQAFISWCNQRGITRVPEVVSMSDGVALAFEQDWMKQLSTGNSMLDSAVPREGIVIKPIKERMSHVGRVVLKLINDDYLLKEQTDFH